MLGTAFSLRLIERYKLSQSRFLRLWLGFPSSCFWFTTVLVDPLDSLVTKYAVTAIVIIRINAGIPYARIFFIFIFLHLFLLFS